MKKSRFSEVQIMNILKEGQHSGTISELCPGHSISEATYYAWRSKYGAMDASMISELKALQIVAVIQPF